MKASIEELEEAELLTEMKLKHLQKLYPDKKELTEEFYFKMIFEENLKQMVFSKLCLEKSKKINNKINMIYL